MYSMINELENIDKIKDQNDIRNFIKKASPFSEQATILDYIIDEFFKSNMQKPMMIMMNETVIDPVTKINKIKHFLLWTILTSLYVGTAFINEPEINQGVNLKDYQNNKDE